MTASARELRYHRLYDVLSARGIPRVAQRVGGALGERGSAWGRHALLRMADPDTWARLVAEFPDLALGS